MQTNLYKGVRAVQRQYRRLSEAGARLAKISGLLGGKVPCDLYETYMAAVREYFAFANQIFDELKKRKIKVRQIVYTQGKPAIEPGNPGVVRSIEIDAPLRPPDFVNVDCPPNESIATDMGAIPVLAALGAIGKWVLITVAGGAIAYLSVDALKDIAIEVFAPNRNPEKRLQATLDCFDEATARGMSPEAAKAFCQRALVPQKSGIESLADAGIKIAAVGLGAFLFFKLIGRKRG